jgi:tripartite-type tricarboxylate transporter receptor subunit TctC
MSRWIAALLCVLALATPAHAQDKYPAKPVTIIVSYAPGGSGDLVARAIGKALERQMGQPVVIQNRGGAGGAIGSQAAAIAPADGYTLLVASVELAIVPTVDEVFGRKPTFTRDQFQPIARLTADPDLLAVNATRPWQSLKELVDDARANPNSIIYTSGALYGGTHLPIEMFLRAAKISMRHLPSNGGGPAMVSVLGNHSALLAVHPGVVRQHVNSGKARLLANFAPERSRVFPDVPTFKELGYDVENLIWFGLFAQAGMPEPIVTALRKIAAEAVKDAEFAQTLERTGSTVAYQDKDEFQKFWDKDSKDMIDTVRAIGRIQ